MRKFSVFTGLLALFAALIAATTAPAAVAPTVSVKSKTSKLRPGSAGWVEARAQGVSSCRLRIGSRQRTVRVNPEHRYEVEFSYRVNRRARPGRYRATLACGTETEAWSLQVRAKKSKKKRSYRSLLRGNIRATVTQSGDDPGVGLGTSPKQYSPESPEVTEQWNSTVRSFYDTAAASGWCNGWTWIKRPDLYERVERFHLAKWLNETGGDGAYSTSNGGLGWPELAREAGLRVDFTPEVGSVAFWTGSPFHSAFVESVNLEAGTIKISEYQNTGGPIEPSYRDIALADLASRGAVFIR